MNFFLFRQMFFPASYMRGQMPGEIIRTKVLFFMNPDLEF